jgi:NADPH:quinone reductase-like Zn-dependent oxidoreductase
MNKLNSVVWKVQAQTGINGLVLEEDIADPNGIGDHDCLIVIEASSLNYRDIMIANVRFAEHPIHIYSKLTTGF